MKLLFAFYALASFWFMIALCRAAKAEQFSSLRRRTAPIKVVSKEFP